MLKHIKCIVSGRVQGVLYRDFVARTARRLGIVGTVENLPNGTVAVVAEGGQSELKDFIEYLRKGSMFSRVEDVNVEWSIADQTFSDFTIRYSGFFDRF